MRTWAMKASTRNDTTGVAAGLTITTQTAMASTTTTSTETTTEMTTIVREIEAELRISY